MNWNPRRIYASEAEKIFGVQILGRDGLSGKGLDGITAKQKKALHALGMNVTGIRYKGEACRAISFLMKREEERRVSLWNIVNGAQPTTKKKQFYRVKKITPDGNKMSPEIFETQTGAEYHAAKLVPPEFDVEIVTFYTEEYYIVETQTPRYFSNIKSAQIISERTHTNWKHG